MDEAAEKQDFPGIPIVTVGMPVFNGGRYLKLAVNSIIQQTFTKWELIIIDDGSTDDAIAEIRNITDIRIRIIEDGLNKGLAARLNQAIDLARGRFFARMDQDDISYPDRFERQLDILNREPNLDVVSVQGIFISEFGEAISRIPFSQTHEQICATPWNGFRFPHPTWLGRIEWFQYYRYAEPGPFFCEDQELLLRSHTTSRFATVSHVLFAYRVRSKKKFRRVFRTRSTLLELQIRYFIWHKKPHYALLSLLMFFILIAKDVWWHIKQELKIKTINRTQNEDDLEREWKVVLSRLAEN